MNRQLSATLFGISPCALALCCAALAFLFSPAKHTLAQNPVPALPANADSPPVLAQNLPQTELAGPSNPQAETRRVRCTVILQTRSDRLYCYATNQPFRVLLREAARFANGEVFEAEGQMVMTNMTEDVPTLADATVWRVGETNLPSAIKVTPLELAAGMLNLHRVALSGRIISHEWMYFRGRHLEVVIVQGTGRTFRVNLLDYSNARERLPVGTEAEFVGLSFLETFVEGRGPEVQVDMKNLDECRILRPAPWLTLEVARRLVLAGAVLAIVGCLWLVRDRHQIARLRAADRTVRQLNTDLEQRIVERTAELSETNARLRDEVSARQQAEFGLRVALNAEKELHELKSRFVSMVSHEFRTPLGVILSSAEILHDYLDRLSAERRNEHLRDIAQCARHMGGLMENVLLLSRVEAGRLQCRPAPLDLAAFCQRLVDEVSSTTDRRCPIVLSALPVLLEARADESLLRHIFTNLLNNAVKYSPSGSPVEFILEVCEHRALFTVRDRGIGIPEADGQQLFQAFYRGRNVGETPGTGLGLIIVKHCVELHSGKLAFESKEGAGTTFVVALPLFGSPVGSDNITLSLRTAGPGQNITLVP